MTSVLRSGFEVEQFVADCREALRDSRPERALRELVTRAVSDPTSIVRALGEPQRAEIQRLHHASDLTILHVIWAPRMILMPHDHRMAATIGVYTGREDNLFWRRLSGDRAGRVEAASAQALSEGDVVTLGSEIIHSVVNPIRRFTAAIHVYTGDFFAEPRSQWDAETLCEQPFDGATATRLFEEANAATAR